jgi:acyl-coenzyme A thioesterase PaaI-like protein
MAYILDSVMCALASDFDKTDVNSLNFSVSYLNGISKDLESILVTAKVVKGGRAMAFLTAELRQLLIQAFLYKKFRSEAGEIYTLSEGSFSKSS